MTQQATKLLAVALLTGAGLMLTVQQADAAYGWEGRRRISYQDPNDLFYNYYVGPQPSGTAAQLYVSPLPVPAHVGHTFNTYQPLYPHEFMYGHKRSYHTHHNGSGWTRTNVRYGTSRHKLNFLNYMLNK